MVPRLIQDESWPWEESTRSQSIQKYSGKVTKSECTGILHTKTGREKAGVGKAAVIEECVLNRMLPNQETEYLTVDFPSF